LFNFRVRQTDIHGTGNEENNKVKGFAIDANEENMDRLEDVLQKI